jgi:hypothetical protein
MRADRVPRRSAPPRTPGQTGRPRRHGTEFVFGDPATWGTPDITTRTDTRLYGPALARAWNRLHPRLTHRTAWIAHTGNLPILEGTLIRLQVERLPSGATPKPVWLWHSRTDPEPLDVDLLWQAFLRRFDIEHTFRLLKQTLGWVCPKIRTPQAADRWTWLILAAYTQLRLARPLAADLRRPWEQPTTQHRLTPARVRRGFRHLRPQLPAPPAHPNPPGQAQDDPQAANTHPTPRHDVHTVRKNRHQTTTNEENYDPAPTPNGLKIKLGERS